MEEDDGVARTEFTLRDVPDQAGHGLGGIDRIEQDRLSAGDQVHRIEAIRRWRSHSLGPT